MENIVLKKKVGKFQFVKGQNILWSRRKNIKRAGVILYFYDKGEIYFIMGLDKNFKEWTDFGGSVDDKETGAQTAFRELKEETLGIFDDLLGVDEKKWMTDEHTVGIIEKSMVVLFFLLPLNKEEFLSRKQNYLDEVVKRNNVVENTTIEMFNVGQFQTMVKGSEGKVEGEGFPMYLVVSHHLSKKLYDLIHWSQPNIYSPKPPTVKIPVPPKEITKELIEGEEQREEDKKKGKIV